MTETIVRVCTLADLPEVLDILDARRAAMAKFEPRLWKPAEGAREKSIQYFASLLDRDEHTFLLAGPAGALQGFLLASEIGVPPVYDAGRTVMIDDYNVARSDLWPTAGLALLTEARRRLKARGITQFLALSPYRDDAKMVFLKSQKLSLHVATFNGEV